MEKAGAGCPFIVMCIHIALLGSGFTPGLQPPPSPPLCTYLSYGATTTADTCEFAAAPPSPRLVPALATSRHIHDATIVDGWLGSTFVGTFTSQLQAYINANYAPVSSRDYEGISLFNSTNLRSLHLRGAYLCDTPLRLPSMFVLEATGSVLTPAANLSRPRF